MSVIRPSRRLITGTAALALGLGLLPLVGAANAATPAVTVYDMPFRTIGPNAGFPGNEIYPESLDQGVNGRTPLALIDAASGTTVTSAKIRLFGSQINVPQDFDTADGFWLFKDTDADGKFRKPDFDNGNVASTWTRTNGPGYVEITVTATGAATGSERYFLTVHPAAFSTLNRTFTAAILPNAVQTSAGDLPAAEVSIPTTTIDSAAPPVPSTSDATNFLVTRSQPGTEDFFTVKNEANEPGKRLAFFNDGTDTSITSVLRRPDTTPAVYLAPTAATPLYIGDGTGKTKTVATAKNNQKDDRVFVRAFDPAGNLTAAVELSSTSPDRKNDVTAPTYDAYSVSVPAFINTTNVGVSPNGVGQISVTGSLTNPGDIAKQSTRLFLKGADGTPITPTSYVTATVANGTTVVTPGNSVENFNEGAQLWADGFLLDLAGNRSDLGVSTTFGLKDTVKPVVTNVALILDGGAPNVIDPNDQVQVTFSEPMKSTTILDTNGVRTACNPGGIPSATGDPACVNNRLQGVVASPPAGTSTRSIFGTDPGFDWSTDFTTGVITVGAAPMTPTSDVDCATPPNTVCVAQIAVTHKVAAFATAIDTHDNPADTAQVAFGPLVPLPLGAETKDELGGPKFGQPDNRDGVLDSITISWNGAISSIGMDADSFRINSGGDVITPTSAVLTSGPTSTVKLSFTPDPARKSLWQSGVLPTVLILANKNLPGCDTANPCSGLQNSGGVDVPARQVVSTDKAGPSVMSVTTADVDKDGHIDRLTVQYSESIDHDTENPCGYTAGTAAYNNATSPPQCGLIATTRATPFTGDGSRTHVTLKEQAAFDTGVMPRLSYSQDDPTLPASQKPLKDLFGNTLTLWNNAGGDPTIDGAGPVISERRTVDNDNDGRLDRIDAKFSEVLASSSVGFAQFAVTANAAGELGHSVTGIDLVDSTTIGVQIDENAPVGTGDTGKTPKLQYTPGVSGGVTDANLTGPPNAAPAETAATASTDKAGPAIISGSFNYSGTAEQPGAPGTPPVADNGKKMKVVFSEPVSGDLNPSKAKFKLTQGARADVSPDNIGAQGGATDTFRIFDFTTAPVWDLFLDGSLRMTEVDVLTDAAANKGKQITAVPVPGYPTAKLNMTGPAGSNAGYSTSRTFNTGADGKSVAAWLLVVQPSSSAAPAGPTDPDAAGPLTAADDPRFTAVHPVTATVETDGTYKGYLWVKDALGNITHKDGQAVGAPVAEDTIIVAATAPTITNVQFVNATSNTTNLRNGDKIRVVADGNGNDATSWANPGCLAAHMSIDYRQVTGVSSHGQVAPTSCQLFTSSTPDRRHMEFPFVTAAAVENYPVGTVLRSGGASDPGYILEDSSTGIVKRRFHSITARRTWLIRDTAVITVPATVLASYKTGPVKSYRDGALIRATGSTSTWVIENHVKRGLPGAYASYYGYKSNMIYYVPAAEINALKRGLNTMGKPHMVGSYVKTAGNVHYVILRAPNGALFRRQIVHNIALPTLVPGTHVLSANSGDLALPLDQYKRGYRDGVMLKDNLGRYYVISRGNPRMFANATIFKTMGFNVSNATGFVTSAVGRMIGDLTYTNGTGIDFYDISATITVKNIAGLAATRVVLLKGRGTPEAAPAALPNNVPKRP